LASIALVLAMAACSGDDDDGADGADGTEDDGDAANDEGGDEGNGGDAELEALQTSLDEANATIEEQQSEIGDLTTQVETAQADVAAVEAELDAANTRADEAEAEALDLTTEREEFLSNFPVAIDSSLDQFTDDLIGGYNLTMTEAFCASLPTCGQPRPVVHADIVQGANGLELQVPTVLTAGLFALEGSLFAVTGSDLIVPPCNGTPRTAQVSISIFEDGLLINADTTRELTGLGASLMVHAPEVPGCEEGDVFFSATLTPV
jgi:hypothetical protein